MAAGNLGRDFVSAVEKAIDNEKASYVLYISLMDKAMEESLKTLFGRLALQEMRHAAVLRSVLKYGNIKDALERTQRFSDKDIGIADSIKGSIRLENIFEGLKLAHRKEELSQAQYHSLSEIADDAQTKSFFLSLEKVEEEHAMLISAEYQRICKA